MSLVRTGILLVRMLRHLQKYLRAMRESALARPVHIFEAYICIVLASVNMLGRMPIYSSRNFFRFFYLSSTFIPLDKVLE